MKDQGSNLKTITVTSLLGYIRVTMWVTAILFIVLIVAAAVWRYSLFLWLAFASEMIYFLGLLWKSLFLKERSADENHSSTPR
jgi:hypothetical protein